MEKRAWTPWPWALGGTAIVVIAVVLASTSGALFPVGSAATVLLIFGAAALGGLAEGRDALARAPAPARTPERVERMAAPLVPFSLAVVQAEGSCPLSYRPSDAWAVGREGRLSRPLCLPAIVAARLLTSSWTEQVAEPTPGRQAQCRCPWARAALTFEAKAVQAA